MSIITKLLEKLKAKKENEKALIEDIRLQHKVMERQKNANEREYERYIEEARQRAIETKLKQLRKQKTAEMWNSNIFTNNKYLFGGNAYLGRYY